MRANMTNGRRVETATGAILLDADRLGDEFSGTEEALFEPQFWVARGSSIVPTGLGRGTAWFVVHGSEQWVLRHYRRGGFMGRLSEDRYLWTGEDRVRAFVEYRLLASLEVRGMAVPSPVAARYQRRGLRYRCDLITRRITRATPLTETLAAAPLSDACWRQVGAAVGRLHAAGVDHADLNAHNVLLGEQGAVSIIDFDRGRIRRSGAWTGRNLRRLRRSLLKISSGFPAGRFTDAAWRGVLEGYAVEETRQPATRR
jgi:3-deoxy-D-manno-octulosonic acid kinase